MTEEQQQSQADGGIDIGALVHSIASNDPFEQGLARALRAQQGCEYERTRRCPFGQGLARALRAQWPASLLQWTLMNVRVTLA